MRWRADARDFLAGTLRKCTIEELDNLMSTIPSLKVKLVEPALVMRVHASAKELQKRVHALARAKSVTMPVLQYVCRQVCLCACSSHGLPSNSTPHPAAFPHNNNRGLLREAEDHVVQIPGAPALQALVQRARDLAAECRAAFPPRSSRRKVPQRATLAGAKDLVARLDACPVQFSEAAAAREVYKSGVEWEKEVTICLPLEPSPHSTHACTRTHAHTIGTGQECAGSRWWTEGAG